MSALELLQMTRAVDMISSNDDRDIKLHSLVGIEAFINHVVLS